MVYFVAAGLLIALCMGRNPLRALDAVRLRASWLILLGLALQLGLALAKRAYDFSIPYIFEASFAIVLAAMILNRERFGFRLMIAGCVLNIFALLCNGGKMPVSVQALRYAGLESLTDMSESVRHQAMAAHHVAWLGDWIPFLTPIGTNYVLSPGDVLFGIGICLFLVRHAKKEGT